MCSVYIYFVSMLLIRTYFCPVVVNPDFLQNHMVISLTLFIIHIVATMQLMTNTRLWLPTFCTLGEGGHHHNQRGYSMTTGFLFN